MPFPCLIKVMVEVLGINQGEAEGKAEVHGEKS